MRVQIEPDLAAFAAGALPFLRRDTATGNVIAAGVRARLDGLTDLEADAMWLSVLDDGELVGVAMLTPPHKLCLPGLPEPVVVALADALCELRPDLPGITGPRAAVERFVARWSVRMGAPARRGTSRTVYELTEPLIPDGVPGNARRAVPADRELLADWFEAFTRDVNGPVRRTRRERLDIVDRRVDRGLLWLWEDAGTPVSMALRLDAVEGVSRITAVYTPDEHRGRGYAAASVSRLCAGLLATEEVERCMLYADQDNPTSNGVYRRIGFVPAVEAVDYSFG
ncbi:GNAT family N-acetyltransferase [Phytomonospora sp. NPDC050363]|uniref:GNAT family N-acetyltransferase n=1 Tax=Phytomonospora sp. NPDC050363 TaxID=3155642 RepID=UPI0033FD74A9